MKKLTYLFLALLIVACSNDDGSDDNESNTCNGDNPVYLAPNGVTIKACEWAQIGDTGNIDGFTYTVVSEQQLRDYVNNDSGDLDRFVTTQVDNMSSMFLNANVSNQDINNWDVSNVTSMRDMFKSGNGAFNQDISYWDVSNVTDMSGMFQSASFNQSIGDWDVSNVTNMSNMFRKSYSFNQPIGNWDVGNVTDMSEMFSSDGGCCARSFDQDLSRWNVANVTNCYGFKAGIGIWSLPKPNFTNCNPN